MALVLGDYQQMFVEDTLEQLEEWGENILQLENDYSNRDLIDNIFRNAHTVKSSAGFVGLNALAHLTHSIENILQDIREGLFNLESPLVDLLFKALDKIKELVDIINEKNELPNYDGIFQNLEKELNSWHETQKQKLSKNSSGGGSSSGHTSSAESKKTKKKKGFVLSAEIIEALHNALNGGLNVYKMKITLEEDTPLKGLRLHLVLQSIFRLSGQVLYSKPTEQELEEGADAGDIYIIYAGSEEKEELESAASLDMVERINIKSIQPADLPRKKSVQVQKNTQDAKKSRDSESEEQESSKHNETEEVSEIKSTSATDSPQKKDTQQKNKTQKSVRVSTNKLDVLINQVGELVIVNSGFQKVYEDLVAVFGQNAQTNELRERIDQMGHTARSLQDVIMKTRMFPIGPVFQRFHRLVRDLAHSRNKKIAMEIYGGETELDKEVIDLIGEPIMHLIRNSADHGIETPEERVEKGKEEEGSIVLSAYQSGNQISIEIMDDGRGLDREKILSRAIENNIVSKEDALKLSDDEVYAFIFHPGFSTAKEVSDISGRGVGMNVVQKMVSDFKGEILIETEKDKGTLFTLVFPLTLAIISAIFVKMNRETYAVPLSDVVETLEINEQEITTMENHEIINLRGEILPIIRLSSFLKVAPVESEEISIVVVNYNKKKAGLVIDDFAGKKEIVIKNIEKNYRHLPGIAGAVIMGDGQIVLILDVKEIISISVKNFENEEIEEQGLYNTDEDIYAINEKIKSVYDVTFLDEDEEENTSPVLVKVEMENGEEKTEELLFENENWDVLSDDISKVEAANVENEDLSYLTLDAPSGSIRTNNEENLSENLSVLTKNDINEQSVKNDAVEDASVLSPEEMEKFQKIVKASMSDAGLVLSQILGIDLKINVNDIAIHPAKELVSELSQDGEKALEIVLDFRGALRGVLVMIFQESSAREIGSTLMGIDNGEIDEDLISALKEITNIVGTSVLNSIADKGSFELQPEVPEYHNISLGDLFGRISSPEQNLLYMNTEFIQTGDRIVAQIAFLPDFQNLKNLLSGMFS